MSTLGNIAKYALRAPREMLGVNGYADEISIAGGGAWKITQGERRSSRDYDDGGQQINVTMSVVGELEEFAQHYTSAYKEYKGKLATIGGDTYRVKEFEHRDPFLIVHLVGEEEAA